MASKPGWIYCATRPSVIRSAISVAIIVGIILNLINQGDALFSGEPVNYWKAALTFLVPYCVATYGAVTALRNAAAQD